ncbi:MULTISPECIES: WXG100 family type VII secretion target [Amycolatopsis]|uniref:ESAT-6-like protein n=1 Tax=Amycolatopsis samaneae TaxID=664691 RepID=A0ABW5GDC7_9PSEU
MADGIVVDYGVINAAADDCNSTGKELQAAFDKLKDDLRPLTHDWEGAARTQYDEAQRVWDQKFEDLKQVLAQIATALPQIADGYQGTEQGVKDLF